MCTYKTYTHKFAVIIKSLQWEQSDMAYGKIIIYGLIIISGLLYGEAKVVHTLPFRMSVPLFLCVFVSICT